jgi:D-alanyl-D-alanine carboxypeptidase
MTDATPMNDADLRALCERLLSYIIDPDSDPRLASDIQEAADAIEALVAERDAQLKWKEDALLQCAKRQCAKRDARITELEQRNAELERGEILTDKDLLSSVITAVMSGKQSERDDSCRKLQRHILAVEDERDNREAECERLSADNLSLNERLGVCAIQLALSERKISTLAVTGRNSHHE